LSARWTAERDAQLKNLWYDLDLTTIQIGAKLGVSGSAVVNRAHRLYLGYRKAILFPKIPLINPVTEIHPAFDTDSGTWFVDLFPGQEAPTIRELLKKLPDNTRVVDYRPMKQVA